MGTGVNLPGTNSWLTREDPSNVPLGASPRTIQAWYNRPYVLNAPTGQISEQEAFGLGNNDYNGSRFSLSNQPGLAIVEIRNDGSCHNSCSLSAPDGQWHSLAGVLPPGGSTAADIVVFLDGSQPNSTGNTTAINSTGTEISVGRIPTVDFAGVFSGQVDEARVSNIARSTGWLTTEYNKQSNPSGFVVVGAEQSSQTGPTLTAFSLDFVGQASVMGASDTAGIVALANWNSAASNTGSKALVDQNGAATTASATWSSDNSYALPIWEYPGNSTMMAGYLDNVYDNPTTVNIAGLPSSPNGYTVYVYVDGDNRLITERAFTRSAAPV